MNRPSVRRRRIPDLAVTSERPTAMSAMERLWGQASTSRYFYRADIDKLWNDNSCLCAQPAARVRGSFVPSIQVDFERFNEFAPIRALMLRKTTKLVGTRGAHLETHTFQFGDEIWRRNNEHEFAI